MTPPDPLWKRKIRPVKIPVQLEPAGRGSVGAGHNNGPRFVDMSWESWIWRRARKQVWDSPNREVVLRRLRRAESLGLSYEDYTSVLLNRGAYLSAGIFAINTTHYRGAGGKVLSKLAAFSGPMLLLDNEHREYGAFAPPSAQIVDPRNIPGHSLEELVEDFVRKCGLAPASVMMVGSERSHLRCAEQAALGHFAWAEDYFADAVGDRTE